MFLLVPCPIRGQIHTTDCFGANATCSNPNPPVTCNVSQCVCPRGQVIDEDENTCMNGRRCCKYKYVLEQWLCRIICSYLFLALSCNIRRIIGGAVYNANRRRVTLTFVPNVRGLRATFYCQLNDGSFNPCELLINLITLSIIAVGK